MWVAGIDGCRDGWFVVLRELETGHFAFRCIGSLDMIFHLPQSVGTVGVDMPIGLLDRAQRGGREADREARTLLGQGRGSSVFPPPVRAALAGNTYQEACLMNAASSALGIRISKQTFALLPKLREVDCFMDAERQNKIREVHPELSFYELNGRRPLQFSKKAPQGVRDRMDVLAGAGFSVSDALAHTRARHVASDDVLDACAACWTAERIARGVAIRIPEVPPLDSRGLKMEIWR